MDSNDLAHLEKLGYEGVIEEMSKGRLGQPDSPLREQVSHWLKLQEHKRDFASSAARDEREEETLKIARDANSIALSAASNSRRANIIAIVAMVFATLATIIAAVIGVMFAK